MLALNRYAAGLRIADITVALAGGFGSAIVQAEQKMSEEILQVWPGDVPGSQQWNGLKISGESPNPMGRIEVKQNMSAPTLTVFLPRW